MLRSLKLKNVKAAEVKLLSIILPLDAEQVSRVNIQNKINLSSMADEEVEVQAQVAEPAAELDIIEALKEVLRNSRIYGGLRRGLHEYVRAR